MKPRKGWLSLLVLLAAVSCGRVDRRAVEDLAKTDPEFAGLLQKKQRITADTEKIKRDAQARRKSVEAEIEGLKKQLEAEEELSRIKVSKLNDELVPFVRKLEIELGKAEMELKRYREISSEKANMISSLKTMMTKAKNQIKNPEEWKRMLSSLEAEKAELDETARKLEKKARDIKIELSVLKD